MKPLVLLIRDGWGYNKRKSENAVAAAKTPNTDKLMSSYPNTLLNASGSAVGLPDGYQGNSEVGHMTIGSGRVIFQSMARINKAIESGNFFKNKALIGAIENCKKHKSMLHIAGLLQTEGVHSHTDHLYALLKLCKKERFKNVFVHVITDGRDAPPKKGIENLKILIGNLKKLGFGTIATLSGRYYAMDRDKRWERTKKAYDCIVKGIADEEFTDVAKKLKECYSHDETDEFIIPRKLSGYDSVKENDSFIFYNFRTDRTRQLTMAIVEKKFDGWQRFPLNVYYTAMTQYYEPMNAHVAFGEQPIKNLLGAVISSHGLKQLRISETEKYAHVTFFFNGQVEEPFKNEDRILIPSPRVATYDLKPEMSAYQITERLEAELDKGIYDLVVVNIVNGDMIGHTGIWEACIKAVEVVDDCVGRIVSNVLQQDGTVFVFADHGNIEDKSAEWRTSHTTNPVPFILVSNNENLRNAKLNQGKGLQDIAPTVLDLLGIKKPNEMAGESLIVKQANN